MAKALKVGAALLGGAALIIATGGLAAPVIAGVTLGSTALVAASAVLSVGAGLLTKPPPVVNSQIDRLTATIDPRAYRKTVLGETAFPCEIRYQEWFGTDQERCGWIVALASHKVDSVTEIWLNDELAWTLAGGVQSKFNGYFFVRAIRTEGTAGNTVSFGSGRWNASRRLTGCAYAQLEFKVTGNTKKTESPFSSGIPSRVTIKGRGGVLYDPRRDATVSGGAGPMRPDDQSTWRYTANDGGVIGGNLSLQILRVLIGGRINGKLATGCGIPLRRLDLPSFAIAANQCDELVNRSTGGTEPRFRGAGVLSEGDDPQQLLEMLLAACCGRLTDVGGKLGLSISHNDLAEAATDDGLNDDDVIGAFQWNPDPSLEAAPNVVRGKYTSGTNQALYQLLPYPDVTLPIGPAGEVVLPLDLGAVESPSQAQRIAKQTLQRRQYDRTFTAPFDIRAWKYVVGQVVPFTFSPLSFNRRLFRVVTQERGKLGECVMTLREEHASIYSWDANDAPPVQAADPIVYDGRNSPLILLLNTIEEGATRNAGRGSYSAIQTYSLGDMVLWEVADGGNGGGYIRIGAGETTGVAPSDASKWAPIVARGAQGTAGLPGSAGAPGSPGAPGAPGAPGVTLYQWIAFSNASDGTIDFTTGAPGDRAFIGIASNKTTATESSNPADYVWTPYMGPSLFGLTGSEHVSIAGNSAITRPGAPWDWVNQAYSTEGYRGAAFTSFKLPKPGYCMGGLNTDPTTNGSWNTLDYAFYAHPDGQLEIYESGSYIATPVSSGSRTGNEKLSIVYDGKNVRYYVNGSDVRTIDAPADLTLYFDSSLVGYRITDIAFGPAGIAGSDGNPGAPGSPGAPGAPGNPGIDALTISPLPSISIPTTAGGTPKAAMPGFSITVFQGANNRTSVATYSIVSQTGVTGIAHAGGGVFNGPTGFGADSGTIVIDISYGGATARVSATYSKAPEGAAFVSNRTHVTSPASTTYASAASLSLSIGPGGTISADANGTFFGSTPATTNANGYVEYSLNSGATWATLGVGSIVGEAAMLGESGSYAGSTSAGSSAIGVTTLQTVMFRLMMRRQGGSGFSGWGGTFNVKWTSS